MITIHTIGDVLKAIDALGEDLHDKLDSIYKQGEDMAKNVADFVTDLNTRIGKLQQDVTDQNTVISSAIALMNGLQAEKAALKTQLQEVIAAGGTPETVASLQTIVDGMDAADVAFDANRDRLAAAVVANTPAA